jgi:hypothetical protein
MLWSTPMRYSRSAFPSGATIPSLIEPEFTARDDGLALVALTSMRQRSKQPFIANWGSSGDMPGSFAFVAESLVAPDDLTARR